MQSHLLLLAHYQALSGGSSCNSTSGSKAVSKPSTDDSKTTGCSVWRVLVTLGVVLLSAASVAVGAIGATQYDVIRYEFEGFAGGLVAGEPPSLTLIELGQRFFKDGTAGTSNQAGIWMVTVGLYLFTIGLPALQLLACCIHVATAYAGNSTSNNEGSTLWSTKISWWSGGAAKLLATWCALDIFLVGCLAAMLELGALTSTIGDELCVGFEAFVPEGEDCFRSEGMLLDVDHHSMSHLDAIRNSSVCRLLS